MPEAADHDPAEECDAPGNRVRLCKLSLLRDRKQSRCRVQQRRRNELVPDIESHTLKTETTMIETMNRHAQNVETEGARDHAKGSISRVLKNP